MGKYIPQMTITIAPVLFRVSTFSALFERYRRMPNLHLHCHVRLFLLCHCLQFSFVGLADQFRQIWYRGPDLLCHTLQQPQPFRSDGIYALQCFADTAVDLGKLLIGKQTVLIH